MQIATNKGDHSKTIWPTPRYTWHNMITPNQWPDFMQRLVALTYDWRSRSSDSIWLNNQLFEFIGWDFSEYPRLKEILVDKRYFKKHYLLWWSMNPMTRNTWKDSFMLSIMVSLAMSYAYSIKRFLMWHQLMDIDCYCRLWNLEQQDPSETHLARLLYKPIDPGWAYPTRNGAALLSYCRSELKYQFLYSQKEIESILDRGFLSLD